MGSILDAIRWALINLCYPAVVLGVFGIFIYLISHLLSLSQDKVRATTAALLPLVLLILALAAHEAQTTLINPDFLENRTVLQLILGILIGLFINRAVPLMRGADGGRAVCILFLSTVACFVFYVVIQQAYGSLFPLFISGILAAGLDVVFRGSPQWQPY
jgi:hypothetical protein